MGGGPTGLRDDKLLVVLAMPEPAGLLDPIRKRFPELKVEYYQSGVDMFRPDLGGREELFKDATILVTFNGLPREPSDAPKLELLHLLSAGSNHIQKHPIYTSTDVPITTSSGIHGPQISEWVVMTTLVRTHFYNQLHDAQKERKWAKYGRGEVVHDLVGQRLGVLGYGSIGRQVGRVAKAMGMDVIAYTATPKDTPESRADHGFIVPGTGDADGSIPSAWYSGLDKASLHNFLAQDIDILLVSVPLTKETTHFLSTEEFHILSSNGKRKAFISNISRGQIIDQPALVQALHDGTLSGAALDVTDPEPLPEEDPLWEAPNCVITPHISGNGAEYLPRSLQILEENLDRRMKGKPLLNVVDKKRGY
ncbi:hypothetical protein K490DRAFT_67509 [Saccharata proteae CBS 121410]|uniref:D-isomer specific 2-hydroxyacid dehydrogenase NAD-binding domain-containing protein n=1 Tax=Saccharata proteae CBS 121410 TaxID=1314787 RepID=A0A9P4HU33_9PEZI|nr:hypothetical protein K490DRAFT_67509 [Saccharata proteae CBS 121410]